MKILPALRFGAAGQSSAERISRRDAAQPREPRGLLRRLSDLLLGRGVTLGLAAGALLMGVLTFTVLSDGSPLGPTRPGQVVGMVLAAMAFLLLLFAALAGRLVRMWADRRRGYAGSKLHTRLVVLFSVVAIVPSMLVAGFAALFFNLGIQAWFSDRVRTALDASLLASRAYLAEHQQNIRADAFAMANDLNRAVVLLPEQSLTFARVLGTQAGVRGLTEAVVFEPVLGRVIAHAGVSAGFQLDPPPHSAIEMARSGEVVVLTGEENNRARAVIALAPATGLLLMIGRPVDPQVIEHMQRTEAAVEAYRQIDERRRFIEGVLAGVSAGVIGLDADGSIHLPNRRASELLGLDLDAAASRDLAELVPEFAPLLELMRSGGGAATAEIRIGPPSARRTLLARISAETSEDNVSGYVLTFDDITALLTAQRQAAWADVARRIAHEIKNPLTPIQLSAERLKRRYLKQIHDDPETFTQCTDTIVRQVGDIGRMVDEFSAFARMPQPVIKPEKLHRLIEEALVLQRHAHGGITYRVELPGREIIAACDRRLMGQALTNLLTNAADAIAMRAEQERPQSDPPPPPGEVRGEITLRLTAEDDSALISVTDDGIGLPGGEERERLAEPYVTHKVKGTGLGLAIVKKIMEDHGGTLILDDAPDARGARATLRLPWRGAAEDAMEGAGVAAVATAATRDHR